VTDWGSPAFNITIEGQDKGFICHGSDTLLGGALRAGFGVPYECGAGGCGSCKFELIHGEVEESRGEAPGLRPADRRKGKRLACISNPRSDCQIRVRCDPIYQPKIEPVRHDAKFVTCIPLTHDLWEFRFETTEAADFLPGQYAKLELPGVHGTRSYSMSNIKNAEGQWHFQIKRVVEGEATSVLFERLTPSQCIVIDAPYSIAHLKEGPPCSTVCIAGGSGLAPMVSILRGLGMLDGGAKNAVLYYGARGPDDVVDSKLFADIDGFDPKRQYRPVISDTDLDPDRRWSGPVGMVHEFIADDLSEDGDDTEFYIAGPPPMVDAVRRHLVLERHVSVDRLHYDRFY